MKRTIQWFWYATLAVIALSAGCVDDAHLSGGNSAQKKEIGAGCTKNEECKSNVCKNSVCASKEGTGKSGDACTKNEDCKSGICEEVKGKKICVGKADDTCSAVRPCSKDHYCKTDGGKSTCEEKLANGGACSVNIVCLSDLCDLTGTKATKTCVLKDGETCTKDTDCAAVSFCNASKKCAAKLPVGETCTKKAACISDYCMGSGTTICVSPVDGECQNDDTHCATGLYCDTTVTPNGACKSTKGQTAACTNDNECQSKSCTNNACA